MTIKAKFEDHVYDFSDNYLGSEDTVSLSDFLQAKADQLSCEAIADIIVEDFSPELEKLLLSALSKCYSVIPHYMPVKTLYVCWLVAVKKLASTLKSTNYILTENDTIFLKAVKLNWAKY